MARKPLPDLLQFLKPYNTEVQQTALKLRDFVLDLYPDSNELIYNNYNAVAIAYSTTDAQKDAFCHIAVYNRHVNFGFNKGTELKDTQAILKGSGASIRHITVKNIKDAPQQYIGDLLKQAYQLSIESLNSKEQIIRGLSFVKASSPNKKRSV